MSKISLFGYSNFDRARTREKDLIPPLDSYETTEEYFRHHTFINTKIAPIEAKDLPQPTGKRIY